LNHPHIATIHGLEVATGVRAVVMELIEGPTLADRLSGGPLGVTAALEIAQQLADALEAAHDKGIIHRDLKPANIKLTATGRVKVLDFGLAKAVVSDPRGGSMPTDLAVATRDGVIAGTPAYMSPEQALGRTVDKRSDMWAFGCVVYEMLTARAAFGRATIAETLVALLERDPDWERLPANLPAGIRRMLHRCLEKDPRRRLRDIADAALDVDEALSGGSTEEQASVVAPSRARGTRRAALLGLSALALIGVGATAAWLLETTAVTTPQTTRFIVALPPGQTFPSLSRPAVTISPDGRRLAFGNRWIFLRDLDQTQIRTVATPTPAESLFFSPDGQWVGYYSTGQLLKVPVSGGSPQVITTADPTGATWPDENTIVFAESEKGLFRVAADGGTPELLFAVKPPTLAAWPQVLPGGRFVLYSEAQPGMWDQADIVVRALDGSDRQVVLRNAPAARYAETGHLVYGAGDRLMAAPFDLAARRVTGDGVPLPEPVNISITSGLWQAVWSRTGTLVHVPPVREPAQLVWVDRSGNVSTASGTYRQYSDLRLSPDGHLLAAHQQNEENDIWINDLTRGTSARLTIDRQEDETPVWSPDGRVVAYAASRPGPTRGIYRRAIDASGSEELVWRSAEHTHVIDWSPDGRTLIIHVLHPTSGSDLLLLDLDSRQVRPLIQTRFNERYGRVSPNGKWIAYTSDESGREEIYVQPFPTLGTRKQISNNGGTQPIWSHTGRELFYRGTRDVMSSTMTSTLAFAPPRPLFTDRFERPQPDGHITYDVAPNGRFLMIAVPVRGEGSASPQNEIHVVLNWLEELKRRVPAR